MLLVCHFLAFTFLLCVKLGYWCAAFSVSAATMLTAANITKPGCPRKCGNVTIPYPFGIGTACSMGYHYNVTCIDSSIPSLYQEMFRVLDISETQVRLEQGIVASSCDNDDDQRNKTPADYGLNNYYMKGYPYAFSDKDNMFIVIGCHHYGLLEVQTRAGRKAFSCVAVCTKKEDLHDGTCSGFGCCQVPITKGLENVIKTRMERIYYDDANISSGNCSYAFIGDASGEFKIRRALDLQDPLFGVKAKKFPAVMEWFITNQTCSEAMRNSSSYACQQNTRCIDLDQTLEVQGYRCQCRPGYEGNPYLSPGCTDINECEGPSNPCSDICRNTPGQYRCSCPRGYHGDGRKDGIGCLPKTSQNVFALGFGIGLGSMLLILAGTWLLSATRRRKLIIQRAKNFKRNGGLLLQQHMSSQEGIVEKTRIFSESELGKATDHFNEDRVLGQGGQGTVYKGMLSDGSIVAIKKSKIVNQSQLDQFINEVVLLSQINHRNIVKLLGCCLETEVPLLVYEFIPNGALSTHIHDPSVEFPITWEMRLQIATDVAGALTYLHSASSKPIFHRDIKTANILLDEKYRAKLSDFGMSRSIDINQTHLTTRVQGTFGYLDPEYFQSNHFTAKSDVYSFGVVLVELLTGKKAILHTESFSGKSLVSWFLSSMQNTELEDILAPPIANDGGKRNALAVAKLAKRCLNVDGKQRPSMREVAWELEIISQQDHLPVLFQENLQEVIDQTLNEMTESIKDELLPLCTSFTQEDCSLP